MSGRLRFLKGKLVETCTLSCPALARQSSCKMLFREAGAAKTCRRPVGPTLACCLPGCKRLNALTRTPDGDFWGGHRGKPLHRGTSRAAFRPCNLGQHHSTPPRTTQPNHAPRTTHAVANPKPHPNQPLTQQTAPIFQQWSVTTTTHPSPFPSSQQPDRANPSNPTPQLDKLVGLAMLVAASVVFLYYTIWTLLMVRPSTPSPTLNPLPTPTTIPPLSHRHLHHHHHHHTPPFQHTQC